MKGVRTVGVNRTDIETFVQVLCGKKETDQNLFLEFRVIGLEKVKRREFISVTDKALIKKVCELVELANSNRWNTFCGVALRDDDKRGNTENCAYVGAVVVDYDEFKGVPIKNIENEEKRQKARESLLLAIKSEEKITPTMIVDSGNGYHAYYCFSKIVNAQKNARAIEAKSRWLAEQQEECPGDPALTRLAQLIRVPGSMNYKCEELPRECKVVEFKEENVYDFATIPESVATQAVAKKKISVKSTRTKLKQEDAIFFQCKWLRWMKANPEKQSYDLWWAAATTCAYFGESGREIFHDISAGYPAYTKEETDQKFNEALKSHENEIGPVTYATLQRYGFDDVDEPTFKSPALFVEWLIQIQLLAKMGLEYDERKDKYDFNPNIFAEYYLEKYQTVLYEGKMFLEYDAEKGIWVKMEEKQILRNIRNLIKTAQSSIYRPYMGDQAMAVLELEAPEIYDIDTRKDLLNLSNCMFSLNTFETLSHDSSYFSTVQSDVLYQAEAKCPLFEESINAMMANDQAKVAIIQELLGYLLTTETRVQKAFFLLGDGANGKSVLLEIITNLIGVKNVSHLSLQDIGREFARWGLVGKTVNIAAENEVAKRGFDTQAFKQIVSGDRIPINRKYHDVFSYAPVCKLVFAVNSLPQTSDMSHGLFRRMFIIPFTERFDGEKADKNLLGKLLTELPGILNWALKGLQRLRSNNFEFTKSEAVENSLEQFKDSLTPVREFVKDNIVVSEAGTRLLRNDIIDKYKDWCVANGLAKCAEFHPIKFWNRFRASCKDLNIPVKEQQSNKKRYFVQIGFNHKQ